MPDIAIDVAACDNAKNQLVDFGRRLVSDRLSIGTSGNLSVRVGEVVAITPSSRSYHDIGVENICLVDLDGVKLEGEGNVSSEWPMHSLIYKNTNASAVVHTHSPDVVALSATCSELPAIHYAIASLGGPIRVVNYQRFGSDALAQEVLTALKSRSAAILQNHGGITYGASLSQAYDRALLLEWLANVYRLSLQFGSPRILTSEELAEVLAEVERRRYGGYAPVSPAPDL